ncbi:pentapeptide repeat-containing protein [Aureimonas sp. AU20]|uniref:pentapeptide repeat-containing protein n=1 Tax=Aureimonas sp. AU20 TaxID=1349819 RepID=UPI00072008B2|nr:pentapeptide repeat-containing protein [Aureimonas sp. AU20]ALN75344.1 hypothetical protein M673_21650 [Aureimonas sp. AU20]
MIALFDEAASSAAPSSPESATATERARQRLQSFLAYLAVARGGDAPAPSPAANLRDAVADAPRLAVAVAALPSPPDWWDAEWQGLDLADADLSGLPFTGADLTHANLKRAVVANGVGRAARFDDALIEEARFSNADLSGASFVNAVGGQAEFEGAMLEDAIFRGANLRFSSFKTALLDGADFEGADGWGADFTGADADRTVFRKARLDEADLSDVNLTFSDFTGASLKRAKLRGSRLRGANLAGAALTGTDLSGADLSDTTLLRIDLSSCDLRHVRFGGAWIEGCRLRAEQLGGAVGEEVAGQFEAARASYSALEANFISIGAKAEAGWAYKKGRKMGCLGARAGAGKALRERRWRALLEQSYVWAADRFVEWLCDYGESLSRVVRAFAILILVFGALYGLDGGLVPKGTEIPTRNVIDLLSYSALNMMTSNPPEIGIEVVGRTANILVGLQGAIGIILMGLFGYILGNRIRR